MLGRLAIWLADWTLAAWLVGKHGGKGVVLAGRIIGRRAIGCVFFSCFSCFSYFSCFSCFSCFSARRAWLPGWLTGLLVDWLAGELAGRAVGWPAGRLARALRARTR